MCVGCASVKANDSYSTHYFIGVKDILNIRLNTPEFDRIQFQRGNFMFDNQDAIRRQLFQDIHSR